MMDRKSAIAAFRHPLDTAGVEHEMMQAQSVEQASPLGAAPYVGATGRTIGMETFGASAPLKELHQKFGFTLESIVAAAKAPVAQAR